jgi:hypothetical protein
MFVNVQAEVTVAEKDLRRLTSVIYEIRKCIKTMMTDYYSYMFYRMRDIAIFSMKINLQIICIIHPQIVLMNAS